MVKILKFFKSICTFTGGITLFILTGLMVVGYLNNRSIEIKPHTYLMIDFNQPISENDNIGLLEELTDEPVMSFSKLIQTIEFAATDKNVTGLVAKINKTSLEPAQIQEVAQAVSLFKSTGKKTVAYSQGFGDFGRGNMEYYLASFFDKIYMQPHTYIGLTGISIEIPFLKNLLNKIGVSPEFYARYEYKNAMASLTDAKISQTYEEEMKSLGKSLMSEFENDITRNRKLKEPFRKIINQAPLSAQKGKELNLIDELTYQQQLEKSLKDDGAEYFADIRDYAAGLTANNGDLPTIAVLNLNGEIVDGKSENSFKQDEVIGSSNVVEDIDAIKNLPNLKAVVVRINSPGGSYNAADEIYFALKQLKEETKIPLIVSQSAYAASGGYFISLAGDYILAEPMTITGSIGVLGGKMVLSDLWKKLGVNWNRISFGKNSGILSPNHHFSDAEKKIFNASLDEVYADFTAKVTENRHLAKPIDKIARGRVWTGRQALSLGLIDEIGGYSEAVKTALIQSDITEKQKFKLVSYPKAKSFSEKISDLLSNTHNVAVEKVLQQSGVDIVNLKLFKRLQYDTVLLPFRIDM